MHRGQRAYNAVTGFRSGRGRVELRSFFVALSLVWASLASAGPVDVFRSGLNAEFDLVSGNVNSGLGSGSLTPTGPTLVMKPVGSLDISIDAGAFFGSGQSIPITMMGVELSGTQMQWRVDQAMNVTVTVNGTRVTVHHITGVLTANAVGIPWFWDAVAGQWYDVRFDNATGNPGNNFTITGTLPDLFNLPVTATVQDLVYFGYGGLWPQPLPFQTHPWPPG